MFNQYFYSVFTRSSFQLPVLMPLPPLPSICEVSFSELDVFRLLQFLDPSKAMECDNIGPRLLKHCALALYLPLYHRFESLTVLSPCGMAYPSDKACLSNLVIYHLSGITDLFLFYLLFPRYWKNWYIIILWTLLQVLSLPPNLDFYTIPPLFSSCLYSLT